MDRSRDLLPMLQRAQGLGRDCDWHDHTFEQGAEREGPLGGEMQTHLGLSFGEQHSGLWTQGHSCVLTGVEGMRGGRADAHCPS